MRPARRAYERRKHHAAPPKMTAITMQIPARAPTLMAPGSSSEDGAAIASIGRLEAEAEAGALGLAEAVGESAGSGGRLDADCDDDCDVD